VEFRDFVFSTVRVDVRARKAKEARDADRHKIVRWLQVVPKGIKAQTQLSGSCVFLSTLWALAILEEIKGGGVSANTVTVTVDAGRVLAALGKIEETLKRVASLSKHGQLMRIAAFRYGHATSAPAVSLAPNVRVTAYKMRGGFKLPDSELPLIHAPAFETWTEAASWIVNAAKSLYLITASFPYRVMAFSLFVGKARKLLQAPSMGSVPTALTAVDALEIARFCGDFRKIHRKRKYFCDVASGIMLVLATHLAEGIQLKGNEGVDLSALSVLPTFETSLPWAAAAKERLITAIKDKTYLLFSSNPEHVAYLANLRDENMAQGKGTLLDAGGAIKIGVCGGLQTLNKLQRKALEFLCETPEVAALNIVLSWLVCDVLAGSCFGERGEMQYAFGATANGITFQASRFYDGKKPDMGFEVVVIGSAQADRCLASSNIEYLYAATRDVWGAGHDEPSEELCLRGGHGYDALELERWFDVAHERASYEGRSFSYAMRRILMPLSSRWVTETGIALLRKHKCDRASTREELFVRELLRDSPSFDAGLILEMCETGCKDAVTAQCAVTLAVEMGRADQLVARLQRQTRLDGTEPDSSWALTAIAAPNSGETFVDGARTFVFDATEGVASTVHRRLVRAGCEFDHWETSGGSYVALSDGTTIAMPSGHVEFGTRRAKYTLDVSASDWWDETTGAGVVPLSDSRGRSLLVVPATRDFRIADLHLSAADALQLDLETSRELELETSRPVKSLCVDLMRRAPFVVALDAAGVPDGETWELACVFVAYAYAGSVCGTRLMPFVAARAIADDALRTLIVNAPCPMGHYAASALMYRLALRPELRKHLRCADGAEFPELRDTLAGFRARYGVEEWIVAHGANGAIAPSDSWEVALEARTGKQIRPDQRAKIAEIQASAKGAGPSAVGCVAQIHMGFGKSSVVVPMLVGTFLRRAAIRLVVVTQPARLVAAAAAVVGTLVATHPTVGGLLLYVLGERDFRASHASIDRVLRATTCTHKLVAVMSTADMQALVRDFPVLFYGNAHAIAHIADEVDGESDPLTCEVAIQGRDTTAHPDAGIAAHMGEYYEAAFLLVKGADPAVLGPKLEALDERSSSGVKVGQRLRAVHASLASELGPKHRVDFGMPDDPRRLLAVPYEYAGVPSKSEYVDPEVKIIHTLQSAMRESDVELAHRDVEAKFGREALERIQARTLTEEYWATQLAMPQMRVSTKETVVAFADLLGAARTFVGFSGTMGISIDVPDYTDARKGLSLRALTGKDHGTAKIESARCHEVTPSPFGPTRAGLVLGEIREKIAEIRGSPPDDTFVCVVDASGELGVFEDDVAEVEKALGEQVGYFDDTGALQKKEARTRYYRHRDARGVDSEMPHGTVGLAIVNLQLRKSAVEQAIYRLRGLDKGEHTFRFVVALDASAPRGLDGEGLARLFAANEKAHIEAALPLKQRQATRALATKRGAADFVHDVAYEPFVSGMHTHKAEQEAEQQAVAQHVSNKQVLRRCYERAASLGPGASDVSDALRALGIELSPILEVPSLRKDVPKATLRRAFGVGADKSIAVMTIVEAWTAAYTGRLVYTHDGHRISAKGDAEPGPLLLGRYLCDDALSLEEEMRLVGYMHDTYNGKQAELKKLATCLADSGFLERRPLLLGQLRSRSIDEVFANVENGAAEAIKAAVGPSPRLRSALLPLLTARTARAGWGCTRQVRRRYV
jgi:hypothetical protein